MITGIPIVAVWVLDQDAAKEFYTAKLGCTVTNDIELDNGMRWLTVRPAGSSGQELLLIDPARSMLDQGDRQPGPDAGRQGRAFSRRDGHLGLHGRPCRAGRPRR